MVRQQTLLAQSELVTEISTKILRNVNEIHAKENSVI